VYTTTLDDGLLSCLQVMQQSWYSHIPVMDDQWTYVYTLSHRLVCDRIASHPDIDITQANKLWDLLQNQQPNNLFPRTSRHYEYEFVSVDSSIDEVEHLFALASNTRRPLGAVYVSQDGQAHSPLIGIFTSGDVVMLEDLR
jgi:predicted transcriptional regulator